MKKICLFFFCTVAGSMLYGQTPAWLWAVAPSGLYESDGWDITTDSAGNSYVIGGFIGPATFGSFTLTGFGGEDIFIVKYNASGSVIWAHQAGGNGYDNGNGICLDNNGNIYVTGFYQGSATFGSTLLPSSGGNDMFVAKYDTAGDFIWVKHPTGTSGEYGRKIFADASANLYVTGSFNGTSSFDSYMITSNGTQDIFIAKYDTSGNVVWVRNGGDQTNQDFSFGITADNSGNCYITGCFYFTAQFGSLSVTSIGNSDIFIAKYDPAGNISWLEKAGGSAGNDAGNAISADGYASIYLTGVFYSMAYFDGDTLISAGSADVFTAKYDTAGHVMWARNGGGTNEDSGHDLALDRNGHLYIAGNFDGTASFGSSMINSFGGAGLFTVKYDTSGNVIWAQQASGGSGSTIFCNGISSDWAGSIYTTGQHYYPVSFGSYNLNGSNTPYMFIAKLDTLSVVTWNNESQLVGTGMIPFPNPMSASTVISFSLLHAERACIKIFNQNGRLVSVLADRIFTAGENKLIWSAGDIKSGLYFLQLEAESGIENRKLMVIK